MTEKEELRFYIEQARYILDQMRKDIEKAAETSCRALENISHELCTE